MSLSSLIVLSESKVNRKNENPEGCLNGQQELVKTQKWGKTDNWLDLLSFVCGVAAACVNHCVIVHHLYLTSAELIHCNQSD